MRQVEPLLRLSRDSKFGECLANLLSLLGACLLQSLVLDLLAPTPAAGRKCIILFILYISTFLPSEDLHNKDVK